MIKIYNLDGLQLAVYNRDNLDGLSFGTSKGGEFYKADFSNLSLRKTTFRGGMGYARFDNCDLREAWFKASLRSCSFKGADLRGATFSLCSMNYVDFTGADLRGTKIVIPFLPETDFTGAQIEGLHMVTKEWQYDDAHCYTTIWGPSPEDWGICKKNPAKGFDVGQPLSVQLPDWVLKLIKID